MLARKGREGVARPVDQRIELEQAARAIGLDQVDAAAPRRLVGAQAGDPGAGAGERARERLDLAHVAAGDARLARLVEAVDALRGDQRLERIVARVDRADAPAVAPLRLLP